MSPAWPAAGPGGVLVVGDVMDDTIVVPEGPILVGTDRRAAIRRRAGGSGANQAVWLAHFGVETRFAGRVGKQDHPAWQAYFAERGVAASLAADPYRPTGTIVTLIDSAGERSFLTDRGANLELSAIDLPASLLDGMAMLLVSGYALFERSARGGVVALMREAFQRGLIVIVDPGSSAFIEELGAERFLELTRGVHLIAPNSQEASALTGLAEPQAQVEALGRHYPLVALKRGPDGAMLGGADGVAASRPAAAVEALDTTGAGDAFIAGLAAAILAGASHEQALLKAVDAGCSAVTQMGGQPA